MRILAGKRVAPPEDCGGPEAFLAKRQHYSVGYGLELLADIQDKGAEVVRDREEDIRLLRQWLSLDQFDYKAVNCRLQQYAKGDRDWMLDEELADADQSSADY